MALRGAELRALALNILQPMAPKPDKLVVEGPAVHLPTEATTPFALVLHELATNAIKHGAWSTEGRVNLSWQMQDGALVVTWQELGGPSVTPPDRNGLGTSLIRSAIPRAKIDYELPPHGVECRISLEYPTP